MSTGEAARIRALDGSPSAYPALDFSPVGRSAMTDPVEELSQRARALSPEDRARLVQVLLASLQDEPDQAADAAWDAELARRIDEIDRGAVELVPADEVFARVRRSLG